MKTIFSSIIVIAFTLAACQQSSKTQSSQTEKNESAAIANLNQAAVITAEYKIKGMTCTGCENTIKAGVKKLAGIADVSADYKSGTAVVKCDTTKVTLAQITDAITSTGYQVDGVEKK